jgi:hypothetical protein
MSHIGWCGFSAGSAPGADAETEETGLDLVEDGESGYLSATSLPNNATAK